MELWLSPKKFGELNLSSYPKTKKGADKLAKRLKLKRRPNKGKGGGWEYLWPREVQLLLDKRNAAPPAPLDLSEIEANCIAYSNAPEFNRKKADKYLYFIKLTEVMEGLELRAFLASYKKTNPETEVPSYPRLLAERKAYEESNKSIDALLGKYGKTKGRSRVKDKWFEFFKGLYLTECGPSQDSCWRMTVGKFCEGDITDFPSPDAFIRRLKAEMNESAIYLARHGHTKWNRKYGSYIDRDYSTLMAGACWVADHAQMDVAVKLANGRVVFPWLTVFHDMKSTKYLGWYLHAEPPCSDHVFQAFYIAALEYGLPEDVYLDNGKDFRCRDFAGGRIIHHKVSMDKAKATNMLALLNITTHFAIPYNAQAKTIERTFLKIKEWLSKHCEGYRGGNVKERPEKLAMEIKTGKILDYEDFKAILNDFILNVLNKMPSNGKVLQGKSPDDQWNLESPIKRAVTKDALRLFCMRTTRPLTIGRNGVKDSALDVTYWSEWMVGAKGRKVYMRRDVNDFNDAWMFDAENDEYLGNASIAGTVPALAKSEIDKQALKDAMAAKKREIKINKEIGRVAPLSDVAERLVHMKTGVKATNKNAVPEQEQNVTKMVNSTLDHVVIDRKKKDEAGKGDLSNMAKMAEIESIGNRIEYLRAKLYGMVCDREQGFLEADRLDAQFKELTGVSYEEYAKAKDSRMQQYNSVPAANGA